MKSRYRHIVFSLLLLCIGIPRSSVSEAAKICRGPSIPFHTWVQMDFSCREAGDRCTSFNPFTQWNDIGYENGGGGSLRDESRNVGGVYRCTSWFVGELQGRVAVAANARQERDAIRALVTAGWSTARYGLIGGGVTSITCDPVTASWRPRTSVCVFGACVNFNVCWTFTCAYAAYLYQVNSVRPRAIGSEFSIRSDPDIPSAWTCRADQYGTGDGCQCTCGAFDPDCNPMEAVPVDCPNKDDICIPGPQNNNPICMLRQEVRSKF